jgi:chromosomal replication initiation ATPase DnaA
MSQIALPLGWPADEADDAFLVSASNMAAVRHLESPGRWSVAATILTGPRKSGRSLLARIVARRTGGTMIDDAERHPEIELFHAWNAAQATRRPLVIVADAPPPQWRIGLPDLASRLSATPHVAFDAPDEDLIGRLVAHLLERRGLSAGADVIAYVAPRIERSHHAVIGFVDSLDAASLAAHRAVTVPLARAVMQKVDAVAAAG